MLSNCNAIKTKLLYELMRLEQVVDERALGEARADGHPLCAAEYQELCEDIKRHQDKLRAAIEGLSREGKFI